MGTQLAGKTLGIVGLGRIGQAVAKRALAFEMRVLGYDPFLSARAGRQARHRAASKKSATCCRKSITSPSTRRSRPKRTNLIDKAAIALMKPGVRLINAARGGIYNEEALVEGLKSGKLGGVALDVFVEEPCTEQPAVRPAQRPLHAAPRREHRGSPDASRRRSRRAADRLFHHGRNPPRREHGGASTRKRSQRSAAISTWPIASACCSPQWHPAGASACQLTYRGEVAEKNTKLLTAAFCRRPAWSGLSKKTSTSSTPSCCSASAASSSSRNRGAEPGAFSSFDVGRSDQRQQRKTRRQRHALRQRHAAAGPPRRFPPGSLSRRHPAGLHATATCPASSAPSARSSASTA